MGGTVVEHGNQSLHDQIFIVYNNKSHSFTAGEQLDTYSTITVCFSC